MVKGRWTGLPLSHRYYLLEREIVFQSKHAQAVDMLSDVAAQFPQSNILVVSDSWFGNDGLWSPLCKELGGRVHMLSRLRSNNNLFGLPETPAAKEVDRPRKYGARWRSAGFKELKQDTGSSETQNRHPVAAKNHLGFCMMATSLTWIYA